MPFVWWGVSALASVFVGMVYEKESNKKIVSGGQSLGFWDKAIMAAAGIAALWVWRSTK